MATILSTVINSKWKILLLIWFWTLSANLINQVASQSHNCSHVKCPPMSQITCPEDSYIREIKEESNLLTASDNYERIEEIFVHCCVTQKCSCKTCHIPSCHNTSLVLMETIPETETPGKCCGQYECIFEPNCPEIINSNGLHWLTDCQRCQCLSGQRVCYRSCDETFMPPQNCISPNLNRFFSNGDTWKEDPCTVCECRNGKNNCQTSLCKPKTCTTTVKIPGECCPKCVINSSEDIADIIIVTTGTTPILNSTKTSTIFLPDIQNEIEEQTTELEIVKDEIISTAANSTTPKTITTESPLTTTTTTKPKEIEIITTTSTNIKPINYDQIDEIHILVTESPQQQPQPVKKPILLNEPTKTTTTTTTQTYHLPCTTKEPPVTYSIDNSDTVQVIQPQPVQQYFLLFIVLITILILVIILLLFLYIHERSKKRSYDPVPRTDDNFNKITTKIINIECP